MQSVPRSDISHHSRVCVCLSLSLSVRVSLSGLLSILLYFSLSLSLRLFFPEPLFLPLSVCQTLCFSDSFHLTHHSSFLLEMWCISQMPLSLFLSFSLSLGAGSLSFFRHHFLSIIFFLFLSPSHNWGDSGKCNLDLL